MANIKYIYPKAEQVSDISIVQQKKPMKMHDYVARVINAGLTAEQLHQGKYDSDDILERYKATGVLPVGRRYEDYFEILEHKKRLEIALKHRTSDLEQIKMAKEKEDSEKQARQEQLADLREIERLQDKLKDLQKEDTPLPFTE